MDSVFGFVGNGFAVVAADATAARSILVFKHDFDKVNRLDDSKLIAGSGVAADTNNFLEFIQKNMKLYELENDNKLNTAATASFVRNELATALRRGPFQTNLVLAGYDTLPGEAVGSASLYFIDYLASSAKVNFAAHGYASNFILSVFDRDWKAGLDEAGAIDLAKRCIHELHTRFLISQPKFIVKIVDKNGIRNLDL